MKELKTLTDETLIDATTRAIREERLATTVVVKYFQEIYDRKLYLHRGYPSLFEMATKQFGYCAGAAQRRISSMRLIKDLPVVESMMESGALSLTAAATLHGFFAMEAKAENPYSKVQKMSVVESCLNKTTREVERTLVTLSPEREKRECFSYTSGDRLRISLSISEDLYQKLNRLKDIWSHSNPTLSTEILLERVVEMALEKVDPIRISRRIKRNELGAKSPVH